MTRTEVAAADRTKRRVLLVEDDPAVQRATRLLLEVEGYEVAAAGSLEEALAAAQATGHLDALIVDYHLPGKETGAQVIHAVTRTQELSVPAVLLTGDTSSAIKELQLGPTVCAVSKPVNADELLQILADILDSGGAFSRRIPRTPSKPPT